MNQDLLPNAVYTFAFMRWEHVPRHSFLRLTVSNETRMRQTETIRGAEKAVN